MADQRRDSEHRPSPEALLAAAHREESRIGKLRIFVGAAPGVGKTYEMLQQAHARQKDGYDVVVGIVETHGRRETEALLEGLEIVPRRRIDYKGQWLEEMDLDAIIARRPQIVLVDELAHTNAEGSRHPKRYLDVEELMGRGIDERLAGNTGFMVRTSVSNLSDFRELVETWAKSSVTGLNELKALSPVDPAALSK